MLSSFSTQSEKNKRLVRHQNISDKYGKVQRTKGNKKVELSVRNMTLTILEKHGSDGQSIPTDLILDRIDKGVVGFGTHKLVLLVSFDARINRLGQLVEF